METTRTTCFFGSVRGEELSIGPSRHFAVCAHFDTMDIALVDMTPRLRHNCDDDVTAAVVHGAGAMSVTNRDGL